MDQITPGGAGNSGRNPEGVGIGQGVGTGGNAEANGNRVNINLPNTRPEGTPQQPDEVTQNPQPEQPSQPEPIAAPEPPQSEEPGQTPPAAPEQRGNWLSNIFHIGTNTANTGAPGENYRFGFDPADPTRVGAGNSGRNPEGVGIGQGVGTGGHAEANGNRVNINLPNTRPEGTPQRPAETTQNPQPEQPSQPRQTLPATPDTVPGTGVGQGVGTGGNAEANGNQLNVNIDNRGHGETAPIGQRDINAIFQQMVNLYWPNGLPQPATPGQPGGPTPPGGPRPPEVGQPAPERLATNETQAHLLSLLNNLAERDNARANERFGGLFGGLRRWLSKEGTRTQAETLAEAGRFAEHSAGRKWLKIGAKILGGFGVAAAMVYTGGAGAFFTPLLWGAGFREGVSGVVEAIQQVGAGRRRRGTELGVQMELSSRVEALKARVLAGEQLSQADYAAAVNGILEADNAVTQAQLGHMQKEQREKVTRALVAGVSTLATGLAFGVPLGGPHNGDPNGSATMIGKTGHFLDQNHNTWFKWDGGHFGYNPVSGGFGGGELANVQEVVSQHGIEKFWNPSWGWPGHMTHTLGPSSSIGWWDKAGLAAGLGWLLGRSMPNLADRGNAFDLWQIPGRRDAPQPPVGPTLPGGQPPAPGTPVVPGGAPEQRAIIRTGGTPEQPQPPAEPNPRTLRPLYVGGEPNNPITQYVGPDGAQYIRVGNGPYVRLQPAGEGGPRQTAVIETGGNGERTRQGETTQREVERRRRVDIEEDPEELEEEELEREEAEMEEQIRRLEERAERRTRREQLRRRVAEQRRYLRQLEAFLAGRGPRPRRPNTRNEDRRESREQRDNQERSNPRIQEGRQGERRQSRNEQNRPNEQRPRGQLLEEAVRRRQATLDARNAANNRTQNPGNAA